MTKYLAWRAAIGGVLFTVGLCASSCASAPDAVLETGGLGLHCPRRRLGSLQLLQALRWIQYLRRRSCERPTLPRPACAA